MIKTVENKENHTGKTSQPEKTSQAEKMKYAEKILESVGIPPQPKVVLEVKSEFGKSNPDLRKVAQLVGKDVSLAAMLIKVANSPMFGAGRVDSIDKALMFLGANTFYNILVASSLKQALGSRGPNLDAFHYHSETIARTCAYIAKEKRIVSSDVAYIAGLFHDCGIPLLMRKYPDYITVANSAMHVVSAKSLSGGEKSIIGIEDEMFKTNHCTVGYLIAKSWHLSDSVTNAILYHHFVHIDIHKDTATKTMVALLLFSEFIYRFYDTFADGSYGNLEDWMNSHEQILVHLNLEYQDIVDMKDDIMEFLG